MFEVVQISFLIAAVVLALLAVELRELMHAVLCFCGMCIVIAFVYGLLLAPYAALFQVLVYAGAVVVLFIMTIMLTERS